MITHVVGIDPSVAGTGIADARGALATVGGGSGDGRLVTIHHAVHSMTTAPAEGLLAVVEDLPYHARSAGVTGMAQGVVRLALLEAEIRYVLVIPSVLKMYATGKGNATKPDMRMALYRRTGADLRDDNQCDAAWLRYMGLDAAGLAGAVEMPKANREALAKVTWPVGIAEMARRVLDPLVIEAGGG
ncbi:MAG: Holliday junction endonuclease [Jiangellaceae bacterium]